MKTALATIFVAFILFHEISGGSSAEDQDDRANSYLSASANPIHKRETIGKTMLQQRSDSIDKQMARMASSRRVRTSQNRMQASLLRARLRQLAVQSLTPNQLQTESQSTDVNNYAASQVHYLQRTVGRMTATVRKMGVKVDKLEKWKEDSDERIRKLEQIVNQMQKQGTTIQDTHKTSQLSPSVDGDAKLRRSLLDEYLHRVVELQNAVSLVNASVESIKTSKGIENYGNDTGVQYDYQRIRLTSGPQQKLQSTLSVSLDNYTTMMQQTYNNGAAISSLKQTVSEQSTIIAQQKAYIAELESRMLKQNQELKSINEKNLEQDISISNFNGHLLVRQYAETTQSPLSDNHTTTSARIMHTPDRANEIVESMDGVKESIFKHEKMINRLYSRVGNTQRCCRMITLISRRLGIIDKRAKEARSKADSALRVMKVEKQRIESANSKITSHQLLISRLQADLRDRDRNSKESNSLLIGLMKSQHEAMNETINSMYENHWEELNAVFLGRADEIEQKLLHATEGLGFLLKQLTQQELKVNTTVSKFEDLENLHSFHREEILANMSNIIQRIVNKEKKLKKLSDDTRKMYNRIGEHHANLESLQRNTNKTMKAFLNDIQSLSSDLRKAGEAEVKNHFDDLSEKLMRLASNVTELNTAAKFANRQMSEFISYVDILRAMDDTMENEIKILKENTNLRYVQVNSALGQFRDEISGRISSFQTNARSCCDVTIDLVASLNVTVENYRSEQQLTYEDIIEHDEEQGRLVSELQEKTSNVETRQTTLATSVEQLSDSVTSQFASLRRNIANNVDKLIQINESVRSDKRNNTENLHGISERLKNMEEQHISQENNIHKLQEKSDSARNDMVPLHAIEEELLEVKKSVISLATDHDRIESISEDTLAHAQRLKSHQSNIEDLKSFIDLNLHDIERALNDTRNIQLDLKLNVQAEIQKIEYISTRLEKVQTDLLKRLADNQDAITDEFGSRIEALETTNSSLRVMVNECIQDTTAVKDGLRDLRKADGVVSDALSSHQEAILKHDHLHRNLTAISQEVREVMDQHGVALVTITEIMQKLNKSFIEGSDVIDQSLTTKFQNQKEELKTIRVVMGNFSRLMNKVLSDQLAHDLSHTTIRNRQRSLMESYDLHDSMISELTSTSSSNTKNVRKLTAKCVSNTNQLLDVASELENHERRLRSLDIKTLDLVESKVKMNKTQILSIADAKSSLQSFQVKMDELSSQLSSLETHGQVRQSTQENKIEEHNQAFQELREAIKLQNASLSKLFVQTDRAFSWNIAMSSRFDSLEKSAQNISALRTSQMKHKAEVREIRHGLSNIENAMFRRLQLISSLQENVTTLERKVSRVMKDIDTLNASVAVSPMPAALLARETSLSCPCNAEVVATHEKQLSELLGRVASMQENKQHVEKSITELTNRLPEMLWQNERIALVSNKVAENEMTLQNLNNSAMMWCNGVEGLRKTIKAQSNTLQSMHGSNSDIMLLIQTLQSDVLQHGVKLNILDDQTREMKNKVVFVEDEMHSSDNMINLSIGKALEEMTELKYNVSDMNGYLSYIEYNVELNYNSTQLAFNMLDEHELHISQLSSESDALVSSLVSSMESLDSELNDVNDTFVYEISDMKEWLNDFQAAFDTSNRQLGRYGNEFKIMMANATNQFNYFSTSIDILTKIIQESNEAVDENRDRITLLNETLMFIRWSLVAGSDHEDVFEIRNDTKADSVLSLNGAESESTRRGDFSRRGSPQSGDFYAGDEYTEGYNLEAILNGDVDDARSQGAISDGGIDLSNKDDDYLANYDFGSLERRKRIVKTARRAENEISGMKTVIEHLQSTIYKIENQTLQSRDAMALEGGRARVTFSAGLTDDFDCCGIIKFDRVFANVGLGYDPSTGKFTAALPGCYLFLATVAEMNTFVNGAISMNNMPQVTLQLDHSAGNFEQSQSTNSVILSLEVGDQVWIQTYSGSLLGSQHPAVTFSGYLVA